MVFRDKVVWFNRWIVWQIIMHLICVYKVHRAVLKFYPNDPNNWRHCSMLTLFITFIIFVFFCLIVELWGKAIKMRICYEENTLSGRALIPALSSLFFTRSIISPIFSTRFAYLSYTRFTEILVWNFLSGTSLRNFHPEAHSTFYYKMNLTSISNNNNYVINCKRAELCFFF